MDKVLTSSTAFLTKFPKRNSWRPITGLFLVLPTSNYVLKSHSGDLNNYRSVRGPLQRVFPLLFIPLPRAMIKNELKF